MDRKTVVIFTKYMKSWKYYIIKGDFVLTQVVRILNGSKALFLLIYVQTKSMKRSWYSHPAAESSVFHIKDGILSWHLCLCTKRRQTHNLLTSINRWYISCYLLPNGLLPPSKKCKAFFFNKAEVWTHLISSFWNAVMYFYGISFGLYFNDFF